MISKRDSKPFLIKQAIGGVKTTKEDTIYESNWKTVYGLVGDPSGSINTKIYGLEENYDKIIIVNATSTTRAIQENTLIMLDDYPTSNYEYGDYDIEKIFPEYNGEIRFGLRKREEIDMPKLYFNNNGTILYFQLNFDKNTIKGYIRSKCPLPFNTKSYVWTRKPANVNSTSHRLYFKQKRKIGFDSYYQPFTELIFEDAEES